MPLHRRCQLNRRSMRVSDSLTFRFANLVNHGIRCACDCLHSGGRHLEMVGWGANMSARAFTKMRDFFGNRWGQRNEYPMSERVELSVHFAYDDEAEVWYVAKSDIPGLVLEADTPADLMNRVAEAAPELIELNSGILATVVRARLDVSDQAKPARSGKPASAWTWRPVFDAPLELQHA